MPKDNFKPWFSVLLCPIRFISPSGQNSNLYNCLIHTNLWDNKWNEKAPRKPPASHKNTHKSNEHLQHQKWHVATSNPCTANCSAHQTEKKKKKMQAACPGGCECLWQGLLCIGVPQFFARFVPWVQQLPTGCTCRGDLGVTQSAVALCCCLYW